MEGSSDLGGLVGDQGFVLWNGPPLLHPVQGRKQQDKVMDVHVLGVQSAEATCGRGGRCKLRLRCPPLSPEDPRLRLEALR